jgi:3-isopropylmalate/(R)-2-methylmalate dehydratase small subunit
MGSSRPAARNLRMIGVACLVAHSINGLFYRNCVNFALPAMECPGVQDAFEEGDTAEVDFEASTVRNATRGRSLTGRQTPAKLLELVKAGGIYPLLEKEGLIAPKA